MIALQIIFWCAALMLLHSYLLYPLLLAVLSSGKTQQALIYGREKEALPAVTILLAVYNEERVIAQKIESTFATDYPLEKIEWLIGSDQSTDQTETIIREYAKQYPQIRLVRF